MQNIATPLKTSRPKIRQNRIIKVFSECFGDRIQQDPDAWSSKFRKMAATPFTFYRGSAALFFSDMERLNDNFYLDERTENVWIHGDLHAENFGTYMNSAGILVFDVNDFDEAWVAPYTWDLKRLGASLALIGFQKAMSDEEIEKIIGQCMKSYAQQVADFAEQVHTRDFALTLENTTGKLHELLLEARTRSRLNLLDGITEIHNYDRRFKIGKYNVVINKRLRRKIETAFRRYLKTIPQRKLFAGLNYDIKDIVEVKGTGIGSAGYKMYSILIEGPNQALENDIVISMKVGQTPSASRVTKNERVLNYFKNNGHRTVLSQRALQAHADPWIGYTTLDGIGQFVAEYSPYTTDLEWDDINKFSDIMELVGYLGQAVAKIHCVSDLDSDEEVVPYYTDKAIYAMIKGRRSSFIEHLTDFSMKYGNVVRDDYRLFVDAFRNHMFEGL